MRAHGPCTALVSGGFTAFTRHVRELCGFDLEEANELEVADGRLTGRLAGELRGAAAKLAALERLRGRLGPRRGETMAVGDGANDLPMLQAAGLGVAFRAHPRVRAQAPVRIDHGDLTALLFLQATQADFIGDCAGTPPGPVGRSAGHPWSSAKEFGMARNLLTCASAVLLSLGASLLGSEAAAAVPRRREHRRQSRRGSGASIRGSTGSDRTARPAMWNDHRWRAHRGAATRIGRRPARQPTSRYSEAQRHEAQVALTIDQKQDRLLSSWLRLVDLGRTSGGAYLLLTDLDDQVPGRMFSSAAGEPPPPR